MVVLFMLLSTCSKREVYMIKDDLILGDKNYLVMDKMNIDGIMQLIRNANEESGRTTAWDFKYSKSFMKLEDHSDELLDIGIELLESDELDYYEKQVIAYAIHLVEFEKLKYFMRDLAISFSAGKIDENIVEHCFFPFNNWSYIITKNYKDQVIKEALKICIKSNKISPRLKDRFQIVLKGTAWKNVREHLIMVRLALGWDKKLDMQDIIPAKYGIRKANESREVKR
jgi:hypothetical protein